MLSSSLQGAPKPNFKLYAASKDTGTKHSRTVSSTITVSFYNQRPGGCIVKLVPYQSPKEYLLNCNFLQLYPDLDSVNTF